MTRRPLTKQGCLQIHVRKIRMKDFLFTLLAWLFTLPVLVGAIVFSLYNPDPVNVTINPFRDPVSIPVYAPVLAAVAFGFLFGALMTWASMGRLRKECRDHKKQIKLLEKQIDGSSRPSSTPNNYSLLPSSFLNRP